uniref:RING-type domain-containing protein n=1 Tax=Alexandrium andersonii TaxID=327968 RepID=A0A7S2GV45_9DINO
MEVDCAICFNSVAHPADLPCACKADYCTSCWDRALAQSFNTCGRARCPTCRMPVRVDFDADTGRLIFSKDSEPELPPGARECALSRLGEQARPAQERLLRQYGDSLPADFKRTRESLRAMSDMKDEAGALRVRSCAESFASRCMEEAPEPPQCVCGQRLERISCSERAVRYCQMLVPHVSPGTEAFDRVLQKVAATGPAYCDLCQEGIPPGGAVWTCELGNRTILHANAFDICDSCFARHSLGLAPAPGPKHREVPKVEGAAAGQ